MVARLYGNRSIRGSSPDQDNLFSRNLLNYMLLILLSEAKRKEPQMLRGLGLTILNLIELCGLQFTQ